VIRSDQETCAGIIKEYEGFGAKYLGDGTVVYFGYPRTLERFVRPRVYTGEPPVTSIDFTAKSAPSLRAYSVPMSRSTAPSADSFSISLSS
jgi:hypothetical protein